MNYAELNDFYLPPLGRNDLVGNQNDSVGIGGVGGAGSNVLNSRNDYYVPGTRFSRRIHCISEEEDRVEGSASREVVSSDSSEESKSELNDFYLPPLDRNDFVSSHNKDGAAIDIVPGTQISYIPGEEDRVKRSASKEVVFSDLLGSSSSEESKSDLNPESEFEEREMGGVSIDDNEAMEESSCTSTDMDDYSPNFYGDSRGSRDLVDELPGADMQTGNEQGLMVQPQTATTLSVSDSLELGSVSTNTGATMYTPVCTTLTNESI